MLESKLDCKFIFKHSYLNNIFGISSVSPHLEVVPDSSCGFFRGVLQKERKNKLRAQDQLQSLKLNTNFGDKGDAVCVSV